MGEPLSLAHTISITHITAILHPFTLHNLSFHTSITHVGTQAHVQYIGHTKAWARSCAPQLSASLTASIIQPLMGLFIIHTHRSHIQCEDPPSLRLSLKCKSSTLHARLYEHDRMEVGWGKKRSWYYDLTDIWVVEADTQTGTKCVVMKDKIRDRQTCCEFSILCVCVRACV